MKLLIKKELNQFKECLMLGKFKGSVNKCIKCNKDGYFGSISKYHALDDNWYLICGWCGHIEKDSKVKPCKK